ncbi:ABC transporter permease [Falsiroseomonas sp.]|jgi:NitT/TauT family transport system permease protein|uniref:ABC transporter permease n=1 Tax=Falsiroseomonas sp. TaxID=2870721 RepID=UPI003F6F599D
MSALRRWAAGQGAAVLTLMALLVLWEAAVVGLDIQRFLLPAPSDVVAEFIKDYRMIFGHAVQTVWGILAGYIAAVIFALAASMAMIRWPLVERMVMPIFVASQSVPKIAIAPLILLWIGAGAGSKILVVASIAFFPVVINTMAGFKQVDQGLMDVFRSVDATSRQTFLRLRLPYAVPYIFAGLRIATTLAVLGAIVAEWLAATDGIGYLVLSGSFNFNTARSFAAIILLAVIGMSFFGAMGAVERALSWRRPAEEATRVQA